MVISVISKGGQVVEGAELSKRELKVETKIVQKRRSAILVSNHTIIYC